MPVLLDTDVAIELLRGSRYALNALAHHEEGVYVSSITAAELFYGAFHSQRPDRNVKSVQAFLGQFPRLTLTDESARIFGELKANLRARATPVDAFDLLIASLALENRCALATGNIKHFSKIDGLSLVNWCRES